MHNSTSPDRAPMTRSAVAALVAAAACWGTGTVASKQVVDDVSPLTLLPMQLVASCVFLLVIALALHEPFAWTPQVRGSPPRRPQPGHRLRARPDRADHDHRQHVVLLWALEPVAIMLLAALVLREHIPLALAAAVAAAVAGVLLVVYQPGATGDAVGITLTWSPSGSAPCTPC